MRARWLHRLAGAVGVFVVLEVVFSLIGADPDPIRLALLVGTCGALLALTLDALGGGEPEWRVDLEQPSVRHTGDPRLVLYVGLLDAHLSARTGDRALRERLTSLTDQVLRQRYGLRHDEDAAAPLLGPELSAVLREGPRALSRAEIDRCLTTIEEL